MGLDNFALIRTDDPETPKALTAQIDERLFGLNLCGGFFSGDGQDGSFRGKVYASLVADVTDDEVSLYDEIDRDAARKVATGLRNWYAQHQGNYTAGPFPIKRQEVFHLGTLFEVVAETEGAFVSAWY